MEYSDEFTWKDTAQEPSALMLALHELDASTRCQKCACFLDTPRTIPTCGHTFCARCLAEWVNECQSKASSSKPGPYCPVCKVKFNEKDVLNNRVLGGMVDAFAKVVGVRAELGGGNDSELVRRVLSTATAATTTTTSTTLKTSKTSKTKKGKSKPTAKSPAPPQSLSSSSSRAGTRKRKPTSRYANGGGGEGDDTNAVCGEDDDDDIEIDNDNEDDDDDDDDFVEDKKPVAKKPKISST